MDCHLRTGIIKGIEKAFSQAAFPNEGELVHTRWDLDAQRTIRHFSGKRAEQIDDVCKVGGCSCEDLYTMTPQALLYYLPCYLRYLITNRHDWDIGVVIGLIRFLDVKLSASYGAQFPNFTQAQKSCIVNCLEFLLEHIRDYEIDPSVPADQEHVRDLLKVIEQWKHS